MVIYALSCDSDDTIRRLIVVIEVVAQRVADVNSSWITGAGGGG